MFCEIKKGFTKEVVLPINKYNRYLRNSQVRFYKLSLNKCKFIFTTPRR